MRSVAQRHRNDLIDFQNSFSLILFTLILHLPAVNGCLQHKPILKLNRPCKDVTQAEILSNSMREGK